MWIVYLIGMLISLKVASNNFFFSFDKKKTENHTPQKKNISVSADPLKSI